MKGHKAVCQHHWMLAEANGPRSQGTCKHCGAEREFSNYLPFQDFLTQAEQRLGKLEGQAAW